MARILSSAAVMTFDELASQDPTELARFMDGMIAEAIQRSDARMIRYRGASVTVRLVGILLAGSATIILGISKLPAPANIAFSFTAVITLVNSLEPFFNLRSIWVIQEEALAAFRGLHEELRFSIAESTAGKVDEKRLRDIFERYEQVWASSSASWIGERQAARREIS